MKLFKSILLLLFLRPGLLAETHGGASKQQLEHASQDRQVSPEGVARKPAPARCHGARKPGARKLEGSQEASSEPGSQETSKVPWSQEASRGPGSQETSKVPWSQEASKGPGAREPARSQGTMKPAMSRLMSQGARSGKDPVRSSKRPANQQ